MVEKTITLTGTSTNSIEDAVGLAVNRAASTIDGLRQAEIAGVTALIEDGAVSAWRVRERDPQADPPGADGPVLDQRGNAGDLGLAEAVDGGRGAVYGEADRILDRVGGGAGERDRLLDHRSLLPQAARAAFSL